MKLVRMVVLAVLALCTAIAGAVMTPGTAAASTSSIKVYLADGVTPVGATQLHPGDQVVVKGAGFDPNANTSGLPVPVPPGVPHGTFITFGAFEPNWRPSKGAPESARATDRAKTKWALSADALNRIPTAPFDLRRTVRQQWVPLHKDGSFTAKVTLSTPKKVPANGRWGIYTYGAADAVNASQEHFVPINYSTAPGPNTPKPAVKNLVWAYSPNFYSTFAKTTQGSVVGHDGSSVGKDGKMTFELKSNTVRNGSGQLRYTGTVIGQTRFHLAEIALADPTIRINDGKAVLSLRTSTTNMNGDDALRRIDVAAVLLSKNDVARLSRGENVRGVATSFRSGISPELLAALSMGPSSPISFLF